MSRRALAVLLLAFGPALAQPGPGMDLSQMSGVPRPDGEVESGTLVVRVVRGDFGHPLIDREVTVDGPAGRQTGKTDAAGRARFTGLAAGGAPYTARATDAGEGVASQPIAMPQGAGVKVLLVFAAAPGDGGAPPTSPPTPKPANPARPDPVLPIGTLVVEVQDDGGAPLPELEVAVGHATKGQDKIDEKVGKSDAQGEARFDGLPAGETDGYLVAVRRDGAGYSSEPFRLDGKSGFRVTVRAPKVSRDAGLVHIVKRSHIVLEVRDDVVEVVENLLLENRGSAAYDPGPGGVRLELPVGAVGARPGPEAPPNLTVEGEVAILKGKLPPGETAISVGMLLPQQANAVRLQQRLPFALDEVMVIVDRYPGMKVAGPNLTTKERSLGGRELWVIEGPPIPAGGSLDLTLSELPHASTLARDVGVGIAALVALWGLLFSLRRREAAPDRPRLEQRREELLDQLASLDDRATKADPRRPRRREELLEQLERVYRDLEELGAP